MNITAAYNTFNMIQVLHNGLTSATQANKVAYNAFTNLFPSYDDLPACWYWLETADQMRFWWIANLGAVNYELVEGELDPANFPVDMKRVVSYHYPATVSFQFFEHPNNDFLTHPRKSAYGMALDFMHWLSAPDLGLLELHKIWVEPVDPSPIRRIPPTQLDSDTELNLLTGYGFDLELNVQEEFSQLLPNVEKVRVEHTISADMSKFPGDPALDTMVTEVPRPGGPYDT